MSDVVARVAARRRGLVEEASETPGGPKHRCYGCGLGPSDVVFTVFGWSGNYRKKCETCRNKAAAPTPAAPTPEAIARYQGVVEARERVDAWSKRAIEYSRAGADGPSLVRYYARESVRSVPVPAGWSPGAFDAFVEAFASTIHAAAVQAVAAHRACWVALDVDNFRPSVQAAAHQQGLGHVIAHAESVCRRRLATIGLTVGPAFEDSLASFVAGLTAIASEELEI